LADAVVDACDEPNEFKLLYELDVPLRTRIELIAEQVYGADGVEYSPGALAKAKRMESDPEISKLGTCMVKTHLSLSDNPNLKGVPAGWKLLVSDILTYKGAGFVVPVAGAIKLMPGTSSDPAYRRIDVDVESGKVKGVF
jgi:formate--tetrahydrofolate ligase